MNPESFAGTALAHSLLRNEWGTRPVLADATVCVLLVLVGWIVMQTVVGPAQWDSLAVEIMNPLDRFVLRKSSVAIQEVVHKQRSPTHSLRE